MAKKVGSCRKVKAEHKDLIVAKAISLNGNARSMKGFATLRRFAKTKCGIVIDDLTLRRLLNGIKPVHPPKRNRTGVRPSHSLSIHA